MKKSIHASSAAFMWGETVLTEYDSGCLRSQLLAAHGARTKIPQIYMDVGAVHEDYYEIAHLALDDKVLSWEREVVIKHDHADYPDVSDSSRADVVAIHAGVGKVIHETKGTISKNTRLSVIRKGKVKLNQLAQLVRYMISEETTYGKLVCGYYEQGETGHLLWQEGREFKVRIADDGSILVDNEPSGFTVRDQIRHTQASARVISKDEIGTRPDKWEQKWGGPCTNCVFKATCDTYDQGGMSHAEFVASGKAAAEAYNANPKPDPEPFKVKVSKPKAPKRVRKSSKDVKTSAD